MFSLRMVQYAPKYVGQSLQKKIFVLKGPYGVRGENLKTGKERHDSVLFAVAGINN